MSTNLKRKNGCYKYNPVFGTDSNYSKTMAYPRNTNHSGSPSGYSSDYYRVPAAVGMDLNKDGFGTPSSTHNFFHPPSMQNNLHHTLMQDYLHQPSMHNYLHHPSMPKVARHRDISHVKNVDKIFHVTLDVNHFKPGEITVKTVDDSVVVHGKHEERTDEHGYITREFTRRYVLPKNVLPKKVTTSLTQDGFLVVHAPKQSEDPRKPKERIVPIIIREENPAVAEK